MHRFASFKEQKFEKDVRTRNFFLQPFSKIRRHPKAVIELGVMDVSDELGQALQAAACSNRMTKLRAVLETGIDIEYPNSFGQTALFCACMKNNFDGAVLLLKYGANPNAADVKGITPVHVTCLVGNVKLLCRMIDSGGRLSIRDNDRDGVFEWASRNPKSKSRKAMTEFIDKLQHYEKLLTCHGGCNICCQRNVAYHGELTQHTARPIRETSVMEILTRKTKSETNVSLKSDDSRGFGQAYPCPKEGAGIVSVVPLIAERMLTNVTNVSYECSIDFTMREMMWGFTPVIVKQLDSDFEVHERAILILNEAEKFGKIRHANVLLLMALCQPSTLDMMTLVFENAAHKNLYQVIHCEGTEISYDVQTKIARQLCFALDFIHNQGFIHCGLSSHAVYLISNWNVKLGNFEFMMESSEAEKGKENVVSYYPRATWLYSWMAPEVMLRSPPTFSADVFSYSCIIWEIFRGMVPWSWLSASDHYHCIEAGQNISLSVVFLPRQLYFLRESLKLKKEERQGDIKILGSMLKSIGTVFIPFNENQSYNAAGDASNSPRRSHNSTHLPNERNLTQDKLLFDSSLTRDQDPPGSQCDRRKEGSPHSFSIEECNVTQLAEPVSHVNHALSRVQSERTNNFNARSKSRNKGGLSEMDACLRELPSLSVRELAEHYQQCLNQHKLRQAILRGSMIPHGSCPELDSQSASVKRTNLPDAQEGDFSLNTEPSVSWVSDKDESGRVVSELGVGDLSSTPQLKCSSTPERSDHPRADIGSNVFNPKLRGVKGCHFQQRLRDVGVHCKDEGLDEAQDKEHIMSEGGMDAAIATDPKKLPRECLEEIRLFQCGHSDTSSYIKDKNVQSCCRACDNNMLDDGRLRIVFRTETSEMEDASVIDKSMKTSQKMTGVETPNSDISWDLTQVTPLRGPPYLNDTSKGFLREREKVSHLISYGPGASQLKDQRLHQELGTLTEMSQHFTDLSVNHNGADDDVLNTTFTIEDRSTESSKTLNTDLDPVSRWVDCKLEDIKKRVVNQKIPKFENKANSSLDLTEEINNSVDQVLHRKEHGHPLNIGGDRELTQENEVNKNSVSEFEFQEFYIDDDLNNEAKDNVEGPKAEECVHSLNRFKTPNSSAQFEVGKMAVSSTSYLISKRDAEKELTHALPPPSAVVKPKRRGVRWRENSDWLAFSTPNETGPDPLTVMMGRNEESPSGINVSPWEEHKFPFKGRGDTMALIGSQVILDSEKTESLLSQEKGSNLISVSDDKDSGGEISEKPGEKTESDTFIDFDDKDQGFINDNVEWTAEAVASAETEMIRPSQVTEQYQGSCYESKAFVSDRSTQLVTEGEDVVSPEFKNQEVQVTFNYDSVDSDEWVSEKLNAIREKITRRKHRLVYCISSDEDDTVDGENEQGRTSFITGIQDKKSEHHYRTLCDNDKDFHDLSYDSKKIEDVEEVTHRKVKSSGYDESVTHSPTLTEPPRTIRQYTSSLSTSSAGHTGSELKNNDTETTTLTKIASMDSNHKNVFNVKSLKAFSPKERGQYAHNSVSNLSEARFSMSVTSHKDHEGESQLLRGNFEPIVTRSNFKHCAAKLRRQTPDCDSLQDEDKMPRTHPDQRYDSEERQDDHCLILDLQYHNNGQSKDKTSCQLLRNSPKKSQSGIRKFFLPKERWSIGCRAKLHVELSPTNPHKHHVTTTATDPENGRTEVLLEETIETSRLFSSFNLL